MGQCEELVFEGGEAAFINGILEDSKVLGSRVSRLLGEAGNPTARHSDRYHRFGGTQAW